MLLFFFNLSTEKFPTEATFWATWRLYLYWMMVREDTQQNSKDRVQQDKYTKWQQQLSIFSTDHWESIWMQSNFLLTGFREYPSSFNSWFQHQSEQRPWEKVAAFSVSVKRPCLRWKALSFSAYVFDISQNAKVSIYLLIYVPTLTYGHELWAGTERMREVCWPRDKDRWMDKLMSLH